jgi:hybrid cluster-associated redox disulfide protein
MAKEKITKDMQLGELVSRYPEAAEVMLKHGMHCIGCQMAAWETIEQGAKAHGMDDKQLDRMLKEMNGAIGKKPRKDLRKL